MHKDPGECITTQVALAVHRLLLVTERKRRWRLLGAHISRGSHLLRPLSGSDVLHEVAMHGRPRGTEPVIGDHWPAGAMGSTGRSHGRVLPPLSHSFAVAGHL